MSTRTYRGSGGEPPTPNSGGGGGFKKAAYFFAEKIQGESGPELKKIPVFKVGMGKKDIPVVVLDRGLDYAVRIHPRFNARDVWGNYAVCINKTDSRGCPLDEPLNETSGRWFLAATVIDRSKWVQPNGKNKGKVWTDKRRLVLIPRPQEEEMQDIMGKVGGPRGAAFDVSRSSDQKSSRIGTTWFPTGKMTEEQLLSTFEKAAAEYGMPVEKFIEPIDYDTVLKGKSYDQLLQIAEEINSDSADSTDASAEPVGVSAADDDQNEKEIPF